MGMGTGIHTHTQPLRYSLKFTRIRIRLKSFEKCFLLLLLSWSSSTLFLLIYFFCIFVFFVFDVESKIAKQPKATKGKISQSVEMKIKNLIHGHTRNTPRCTALATAAHWLNPSLLCTTVSCLVFSVSFLCTTLFFSTLRPIDGGDGNDINIDNTHTHSHTTHHSLWLWLLTHSLEFTVFSFAASFTLLYLLCVEITFVMLSLLVLLLLLRQRRRLLLLLVMLYHPKTANDQFKT